jgi:drug/metabolite transporter (DMT)-like permease
LGCAGTSTPANSLVDGRRVLYQDVVTSRAWAFFIAMCALWGLPYLLIKVAVAELDPAFLVFVRLGLAAVVLLPIAAATGSLKRLRRRWRRLVAVAVIGIAIPFSLIAYGEQHITSSLAALLIAADPLMVVVLALLIDASERTTGVRLIGLLVGLIGVGAVLGFDLGGDAMAMLGALFLLGAAACYAFSALMVKGFGDIPRLGSVTVTLSLATVALAPSALAHVPQALPSPAVIVSVLGLGIVCTALGYFLYYSLIGEAGATRASLITYVNPAVAVLLGVLVLGEPLTWATLIGFALIVLGCALATDVTGWARVRRKGRLLAS